jgi:hypothetical protein
MRLFASQEGLGFMELRFHYIFIIGCNIKFHQSPYIQNEFIILVPANDLSRTNKNSYRALLQNGPVHYY